MASAAPKLDLIRSVDALKINPLTRRPIGYGQHIYAYCNIRTNQVIYSLTQILRPYKNLTQLPEAGNNTKPPKLRKDLWRPLWTLSLPAGFQGEAQGLEAWKRLNALRYMHEIYWTPPKDLSRNRTEDELKEIQERLEDRGGSKKETVFDIVKRNKKKMRLKGVMDQKANSIADLAAVLEEQAAISQDEPAEYDRKETESFLKLSYEAESGTISQLETTIENLRERIKELVKHMPGEKGNEELSNVRGQRALRNRTRRALKDAQAQKEQLEEALLMVSLAEPREEHQESDALEAPPAANKQMPQDESGLRVYKKRRTFVDFKALPAEEQEYFQKLWESKPVYDIATLKSFFSDDKGGPLLPARRAKTARVARAVLMQKGGNDSQPRTAEEHHSDPESALQEMIQAEDAKLLESGVVKGERTGRPHTVEEKDMVMKARIWSLMLAAYRETQGTLRVIRPKDGRVFHLGEDFHDGHFITDAPPAPAVSDLVEDDVGSEKPEHELRILKPGFSMEGVKVTWQNILDAEFASTWPETVQHDWMGITRHAAPKPGAEPRLSAQEYYEGKRRPRPVKAEVEVREDVVKSVSSAIIRQLIGKNKNKVKKESVVEPQPKVIAESVEQKPEA